MGLFSGRAPRLPVNGLTVVPEDRVLLPSEYSSPYQGNGSNSYFKPMPLRKLRVKAFAVFFFFSGTLPANFWWITFQ